MKEFIFNHAVITNVVDGDTMDAEIDVGFDFRTTQRLRLLGVDTPERGQPLFEDAKQYVINKVANKPVQIVTYKKDSFGRWLSIVLIDSENLNESLIKAGLAIPY